MDAGGHRYRTPTHRDRIRGRAEGRWGILAALLVAILASSVGGGQPAEAQAEGVTFVEADLSAVVLTKDDAPADAQPLEGSGLYDLSQAAPGDLYARLQEGGMQAVFRNGFDPWTGSTYLVSTAMLFPDDDTASRGLSTVVSEANLEGDEVPIDGADESFRVTKISTEDWQYHVAWRRSNLVLELSMGEQPADPPVPNLDEVLPLIERMNARAQAASGGGGDPGEGGAAGTFAAGDLPSLVLTEEDAPEGAAPSSSGPVDLPDLSEISADGPSVFATLQTAGLQAVHQNCFDPWDGDHFLCSQSLLFPTEGEASRGLGLVSLTEDAGLGDEGGWGATEGGDVLEVVWRRSNVLLWVTMLDQGGTPSLSFEADALPLARQMDAKAVALMQGEEASEGGAGGGIFGDPLIPIALALVVLTGLGLLALWLRRPRLAGAGGPVTTPAPAEAAPAAPQEAAPPPEAAAPAPAAPAEEQAASQVKYCGNCGTPHPMEARFCGSCGQQFG